MEIDDRTSQSFFSRALQFLLRPLRPRLATPKKVLPAGSNQLKHGLRLPRDITINERKLGGLFVYDVSRLDGGEKHGCVKRLYYVAGGGWQMPPSGMHWKSAVELVKRVPGLVVTMVSTPLAPNSPAAAAFPDLRTFVITALRASAAANEVALVGGDSSGGNLALALVLDLLETGGNHDPLAALLLICPAVDLREMTSDSGAREAARHDAVLTMDSHNSEAANWARGQDRAASWISPIEGDMNALARAGIRVLGVTAGWDLLSFDALKLRETLLGVSVKGAWLHWDKQMHCFPLIFSYCVPEAKAAMDWVVTQLCRLGDRS